MKDCAYFSWWRQSRVTQNLAFLADLAASGCFVGPASCLSNFLEPLNLPDTLNVFLESAYQSSPPHPTQGHSENRCKVMKASPQADTVQTVWSKSCWHLPSHRRHIHAGANCLSVAQRKGRGYVVYFCQNEGMRQNRQSNKKPTWREYLGIAVLFLLPFVYCFSSFSL